MSGLLGVLRRWRSAYLAANPDLAQAGVAPLIHYVRHGRREGRNAPWSSAPSHSLSRDAVVVERQASIDYFRRFKFRFQEGEPPRRRVREAIADLACRSPMLVRNEPDVSIVIPVHGQTHFVLGALDSLARQRSRFAAEIIISDNGSPDAAQTRHLADIPWLRYTRNEQSDGLLHTWTEAAQIARGRFLVFLNSDARVAAGWLDELIGSFELFPKAGLISSKSFHEDDNHPENCFARQVDTVCEGAVAMPTRIWRLLNGFDGNHQPVCCKIQYFASAVKEAGYEVWLQPHSCVIHHHQPVESRQKRSTNRILVLDAFTPTPDRDSGSFITVRMLRAFRELGYDVTFVAQHDYAHQGAYTDALQRMGIECLYLPYFRDITEVLNFRDTFNIVLAYRFYILGEVYELLRQRLPAARIILHNVDLHFLREEREAALLGSQSKKISAAVTKAAELELIAKADCTIVHTQAEAAIIRQCLPIENIVEFPYIADVHKTSVAFEDRHDIMFLGGFDHPPNTDAVLHFVRSVWPMLLPRLPGNARFLVVGALVPSEVQALAGDQLVVTGYVEDLRPYFDQARVFVAPIRYGAGIKGKVIQSLCYGAPSVITSIAAEGIGLVSGRQTLIAEDDAEFAGMVLAAYYDRELWHALQAAGYEFVEENFSWKRCLELCNKVLDTADATWLKRHERA